MLGAIAAARCVGSVDASQGRSAPLAASQGRSATVAAARGRSAPVVVAGRSVPIAAGGRTDAPRAQSRHYTRPVSEDRQSYGKYACFAAPSPATSPAAASPSPAPRLSAVSFRRFPLPCRIFAALSPLRFRRHLFVSPVSPPPLSRNAPLRCSTTPPPLSRRCGAVPSPRCSMRICFGGNLRNRRLHLSPSPAPWGTWTEFAEVLYAAVTFLQKCCSCVPFFAEVLQTQGRSYSTSAKKRPNPAFAGMMRWPAKRHIRQATWVVCRLWGNHANLPLVHCAMRRWGGARGDKKWRWRK